MVIMRFKLAFIVLSLGRWPLSLILLFGCFSKQVHHLAGHYVEILLMWLPEIKIRITIHARFPINFVFFFHFVFHTEISGSFYRCRILAWLALQGSCFTIAFAILFYREMCSVFKSRFPMMGTENFVFFRFDKKATLKFDKIRWSSMAKYVIHLNNLSGQLQSLLFFYMVMQW